MKVNLPIFPNLVAMATSLEESKKRISPISFGEKITKIGPADPDIICLKTIIKKKEINANKIYSPSGKFVERAK